MTSLVVLWCLFSVRMEMESSPQHNPRLRFMSAFIVGSLTVSLFSEIHIFSESLKIPQELTGRDSASVSTGFVQPAMVEKSRCQFQRFRIHLPVRCLRRTWRHHLSRAPPDILLLFWSLVADQALPAGYEEDFAKLESAVLRASDSSFRKASKVDSLTASLWLHGDVEAEARKLR